jgi:GxxExxY protein
MPIEVQTEIRVFDQEEFHALDRRIMGVVFTVHNEFGRFLDEELFKREIAARCVEQGITPAEREVQIRVTHGDFAKDYFMDLLFAHGVMFEAKAAERIAASHRSQSLNYLLLAGFRHGRLVNLRPERVEHEFISTTLTPADRRNLSFADLGWREVNSASTRLKATLMELAQDWGGFLDIALYREALTWFCGGPDKVCNAVEVFSGERLVGSQVMHLVARNTAFAISAIKSRHDEMRRHQLSFLEHTHLDHLQWINFNRHQIEFMTVSK